ncbi:MAG: SLBB domain-containing protein [Pseudomonadota bacterium]
MGSCVHRFCASALVALLIVIVSGWAEEHARAADDAPLRIGDVISVSLPGEDAFKVDFSIDRSGTIELPEIGPVQLAGLTAGEALDAVRKKLGIAFKSLDQLSLRVKSRKLLLTVSGYVKKPGLVEIDAAGGVQVALAAAGGLEAGAQLDQIQVRRGDTKLVFNYKRFLDTGDARILPELLPLDTIFVPASPLTGNVKIDFDARTLAQAGDGGEERSSVKIFGEVKNAAIFAFKPGMSVIDLIMRAGGVTRYASVEQIKVINLGAPRVFDLQGYLESGDASRMPEIGPGAIIFVPKQVEEIRSGAQTVYAIGEVARPGAFESKAGASFIDILSNAGGPTRFADTRQIKILRADGSVETFDLNGFTENGKGTPPPIHPGDAILVPEKTQAQQAAWLKVPPSRAVHVMGAVRRPGRYPWSDEMTLVDLLSHAGGPTEKGDVTNIKVLRREDGRAMPEIFDLEKFLAEGGALSDLPEVRAGYILMVPELPQDPTGNKSAWTRQPSERSIYIIGQVGSPGRYAFDTNKSFLDIISAADGPTENADLRNVRISHRGEGAKRVTSFDLARYFDTGDEALLPRVKPGDVIFFPDFRRDWNGSTTINVLGEVGKPGAYAIKKGATIIDGLALASGPTRFADSKNLRILRSDGSVQPFDLAAYVDGSGAKLPVLFPGDTVLLPEKLEANEISWLKISPKRAVQVMGAVNKPGRYPWSDEMSIFDLLAHAGGANERGDIANITILKRQGQKADAIRFNMAAFLKDGGDLSRVPRIRAGYVLLVPELPRDPSNNKSQWTKQPSERSIYIIGQVGTPGRFAFDANKNFLDIVAAADGPTEHADLRGIRISHRNGHVSRVSTVDLASYLETGNESLLPSVKPGDVIFFPDLRRDWSADSSVNVIGEATKPGVYKIRDRQSLIDVLAIAHGPTRYAETKEVRIMKPDGRVVEFDLAAFALGSGEQPPRISPGDTILLPQKLQANDASWLQTPPDRAVHVMGSVVKPGRYAWSDEMSLFDLLAHAGGPSERGDVASIQILRKMDDVAEPVIFNMERFLKTGGGLSRVPSIRAGYVIFVPELPRDPSDSKSQWAKQPSSRSIYIMGEVGSPGRYAFDTNKNFLDIVAAADGPTKDADLRNIRISHRGRKDARISRVNLARYFETGDGRLLPQVRPEDVIFVPHRERHWLDNTGATTVRVLGAVSKPGRFRLNERMTMLDLLAEAGGPTKDALTEKIVVVNMGERTQARLFDLVKFAKSADLDRLPTVRPGDTIYVPFEKDSIWYKAMNGLKDVLPLALFIAGLGA